ncbi:hypothetical protein L6172_03725 [Thalassospiraceae bacterium SW-3-3]|nr:hypothetical protein L6172_03725 [Thalassospiraceae bacterium SW-3-3]
MVTRVATYTSHSLLSNLALQNAAKVSDLQTQAASGYKSRNYSGIADSSQRLLNLESEVTRSNQYLNNATQTKLRLQNMETSVDTMTEIAVSMKTLLIQSLGNDQAADVNLNDQARQALAQIESLLNTNLDGRSLFAGGKTNQPAADISKMTIPDTYFSDVDNLTGGTTLASLGATAGGDLNINGTTVAYLTTDTVEDLVTAINGATTATASVRSDPVTGKQRLVIENLSGGNLTMSEDGGSTGDLFEALQTINAPNPRADVSYFQGDQQLLTARVDDDYSVQYGVLADNPAFEKLVRSLQIMSNTEDPTALGIALGHLNEAIESLPNVQSAIGIDIANIERFESQHSDFKVFASAAITDIEQVDVPLTLAEAKQYETALQASFMSISRASELSLVNFLR